MEMLEPNPERILLTNYGETVADSQNGMADVAQPVMISNGEAKDDGELDNSAHLMIKSQVPPPADAGTDMPICQTPGDGFPDSGGQVDAGDDADDAEISAEKEECSEMGLKLPGDVSELSIPDEVQSEDADSVMQSDDVNGIPEDAKACTSEKETVAEAKPALVSIAESRPVRRARKRHLADSSTSCPVCGITVRDHELENHLTVEIQRLDKIRNRRSYSSSTYGRISVGDSASTVPITPLPSTSAAIPSTSSSQDAEKSPDLPKENSVEEAPLPPSTPDSRYQTYQRVKSARQTRLAALAERHKKRNGETATCPVCNRKIVGSPEELTDHVDLCLINPPLVVNGNEEEEVDIEGDDFEEYTWAGQTRIRATTMLPGGLAASGFMVGKKGADEDDDLDLVVDDDEVENFGEVQYNEADIIPCSSDEPSEEKQRKALRKAFLKAQGESIHGVPSDRKRWEHHKKENRVQVDPGGTGEEEQPSTSISSDHSMSEEIVAALKCKIAEQEEQLKRLNIPKCLICMESYHKPLTSTQCWHVHCEECWLRTLGAKKVCPQCNVITSASDLRQIYL